MIKKITHEEVRFIVNNRIVWERPYKNYHDLLDYIQQQETKDTPLKVIKKENNSIIGYQYSCPSCEKPFHALYDNVKHCPHCGQKLDWGIKND